jgi:4-amino-4-deoxy-L-arabinose transferase-like glycosyltransferase
VTFPAYLFSTLGRRFAWVVAAITIARIVTLIFGDPNLGPDETQYWVWSQAPAFGYFSKPPFVAWSIAATTFFFGDAEWAVRLSAPLYQAGAASFVFLLTRRLAGASPAFWAGAAWLTLPGVFLSSALITTDAPLLFFWSAALFYFARVFSEGGRLLDAALLGAAIGLGFLSKYAMTYFVLGAGLAIILAPGLRRHFHATAVATALLVAGLMIAPNIAWNAANDFQTVAHTAANANWSRDFGHPDKLAKFLLDQAGVGGPIMIILIIWAAAAAVKARGTERDRAMMLIAFAAPAILIVSTQAFISRAHGNWAAVAYPSLTALAAMWATNRPRPAFALKASIALHALVGAGFLIVFADAAVADAVGASRAFKRLRGWDTHGPAIVAASAGYDAILSDDREIMGGLLYYARGGPPIMAWDSNHSTDHHYEAFFAYEPSRARRVLFVSTSPEGLGVQGRFGSITKVGAITVPTAVGRQRTLYLFALENYRGAGG